MEDVKKRVKEFTRQGQGAECVIETVRIVPLKQLHCGGMFVVRTEEFRCKISGFSMGFHFYTTYFGAHFEKIPAAARL